MVHHITTAFTAFCISVAVATGGVGAEPVKDFTFKRVKPPLPGVKKRINIQILAPLDQTAVPAVGGAVTALDKDGLQKWFWDEISPDLAAAGRGRFAKAIRHLQSAPSGQGPVAPDLQVMRDTAAKYGTTILIATIGKKISPALVLAMISAGSAGDPNATGPTGALGLMQLAPDVAAQFDVTDPLDPTQNITGGVAYLDSLLKKFQHDPILALAAFRAGESAVISSKGVPAVPGPRAYVPYVLAAWQVARALCITPPELYYDGCVFSAKDFN